MHQSPDTHTHISSPFFLSHFPLSSFSIRLAHSRKLKSICSTNVSTPIDLCHANPLSTSFLWASVHYYQKIFFFSEPLSAHRHPPPLTHVCIHLPSLLFFLVLACLTLTIVITILFSLLTVLQLRATKTVLPYSG